MVTNKWQKMFQSQMGSQLHKVILWQVCKSGNGFNPKWNQASSDMDFSVSITEM
jgi:hypothetical protein